MNIQEIPDEIERVYPQDVFPDTTQSERDLVIEKYPGFIDRTSAMMARHIAKVIRQKLAGGAVCSRCGNPLSPNFCPECGMLVAPRA